MLGLETTTGTEACVATGTTVGEGTVTGAPPGTGVEESLGENCTLVSEDREVLGELAVENDPEAKLG